MFCPKCGTQALDGAGFCQKCGSKLMTDTSVKSAPNTKNPVQPEGKIPETVPKKKKSKKLLIILGAVIALIVILIAANAGNLAKRGEQAAKDEEYINSHQQSSVNTAGYPTYTDETEGFSFKYPSEWTLNEMVDYGVEDESGISTVCLMYDTSSSAQIAIQKITNPLFIDCVFSDDSEFLDTFGYNFAATDKMSTSIEDLHGVPIRQVNYAVAMAGYETVHQVYIYTVPNALYKVEFTCKSDELEGHKRTFDAIMDSYTITPVPNAGVPTNGTQVTSMDEAQRVAEDWIANHPLGDMAGIGTGAAANDIPSVSAEYYVLELWIEPREFAGNIYVRKSDGEMTFRQFDSDEGILLDDWYAEQSSSADEIIDSEEALCFAMEGDEDSRITFYRDGTFTMSVNLYAGYGMLSGSYADGEHGIQCSVESRDFQGFAGDDVTGFEMILNDDRMVYLGEAIGAVMNGSIFLLYEP